MTYLYCDETGFAMFEVSSTSSPSASYVVVAKNALTGQSSIDSNEVLVVFATTTKQVKKLIEDACTDLTGSINDLKAAIESGQAEAIEKAVEGLTKAYKEADELVKSELTEADAALEAKMKDADKALRDAIDAVQANLDKAIDDLNKAIAAGDKVGSDKLTEAVASLNKAYKAADDLLKSDIKSLSDRLDELEKAMNKADEALGKSISDVRESLEKEIEKLRAELKATADRMEALNREYTEKLNAVTSVNSTQQDDLSTLRTVAAVGLCVAAASMLGNVVLFTMHIKGKKAAA